jgi:ABC-2 type transport system ATP-binding protein
MKRALAPLLSVHNLVKHYPNVQAVRDVSFELERGVCLGLLGPNGAGKTTTVEILEGIVTPSAGEVRYKGAPPGARFRDEAGIMFQSTALQEFITVSETLAMFARLYPSPLALDELVSLCSLETFLERDTRQLSGGQRQRLLLAIALVNDPEIVFLDEPTTGMDPQARRNFWALIDSIKQRGKAVVLTTHYMEEAYRLCDDIIIMDHGRVVARGTPQALLSEHFNDVVLQLPGSAWKGTPENFDATVLHGEDCIEILTAGVDRTLRQLIAHDVPLDRLVIRPRTLEDLFLELTGSALRS